MTALDPQTATVIVRPDALIRTYPQGITETLRLFDGQDVVEVEVRGAKGDVTLQLSGDTVTHVQSGQGIDEYTATQEGNPSTVDHIVVGRSGNRFLIAVGSSREAARTLFDQAVADSTCLAGRSARTTGSRHQWRSLLLERRSPADGGAALAAADDGFARDPSAR